MFSHAAFYDDIHTPSPAEWSPSDLALTIHYELDPFQKHAILRIHAGDHETVYSEGTGFCAANARTAASEKRIVGPAITCEWKCMF